MCRLACLWVFAALRLLRPTLGLKFSTSHMVLPSERLSVIADPFGFAVGGMLNMSIAASTSPELTTDPHLLAFVVLLDSKQLELSGKLVERSRQDSWENEVCAFPFRMRFQLGTSRILHWEARELEEYTLAVLNCMDMPVFLLGEFDMVNPGDEHLPLEDHLLVPLYALFALLYIHLCLAWVWLLARHWEQTNALQHILLACFCIKLFRLHMVTLAYSHTSRMGDTPPVLMGFVRASQVLQTSSFLMVLLLTAVGWTIVRLSLSPRERKLFPGLFVVLTVLEAVELSCNTDEPHSGLCGLFALSLSIVRFLILFTIIIAMNTNLERLRLELFDGTVQRDRPTALRQIATFKKFRAAFLAYLFVPLADVLVQGTELRMRQKWPTALLTEAAYFAIHLLLASCLRPLPPHGYSRFGVDA